ncbi:cytochrome-c oxidase, cbb3-type subunit III [Helicobacter didelphidarum]|uniref:Cytochrome c oxidase subunit III n=1 Tax=Helicobacter didelphidarum TaxID=2040648 RepID=A0A3D8IP79_9HELI|nr:cytochrome-c oxidase, cbb3-type subunit III [Helicobacter didelphidarum]RDU67068.1 cytochrome-c oxidase, cbb3-type subunit III [Helicobacter didelphidarum]
MGWLSDHINMIGFIGAVVILFLTIIIAVFYINKMKSERADGELTTHEWDGIREFSNNIPTGWLLTMLGVMIWAVWYILFGYPLNAYSQIGEYNEESRIYNQRFETIHANMDADKLREMGEQIFLVQCAQCHGLTAEGNDGTAQNLTRWGKVEGIIDTIKHGSAGLHVAGMDDPGIMPEGLLEEEKDIQAVAQYVMSEIVGDKTKTYDKELVEYGKEVYNDVGTCFTCHGDNGEGIEGVGPSLQVYGKTAFLNDVLEYGKKGNIGVMPSFKYLNLSEREIEALQSFIATKQEIQ